MDLLAQSPPWENLTVVGLLFVGVTTLAGIVGRLYIVQERHATRSADAYQKLALYVMQTTHLHCTQANCPKKCGQLLPPDIRALVANADTPPNFGNPSTEP